MPLGKLADRMGSKQMWQVASAIEAGMYAVWPLLDGLVAVRGDDVAMAVVESGRPGRPRRLPPRRVPARGAGPLQAYLRAARNVGYTLGALAAGVALATNNDDVVRAVPLRHRRPAVLNAVWVFRLPDLARHADHESPLEQAVEHAERDVAAPCTTAASS